MSHHFRFALLGDHSLTFTLGILGPVLLEVFRRGGGDAVIKTFREFGGLAKLPQRVVVHCTGWGARALLGDTSLIPIRGQLAWLPPQPGVLHGILFRNLRIVGRRDGIVVKYNPEGDDTG